jgi:histidine decarboxylase
MDTTLKDSLKQLDRFYLGEDEAFQRLNEFNQYISEKRKTFMGYPCNGVFKLEKFLKWWEQSSLSKSPLNDVGNPFTVTLYTLNTHVFEATVLEYFADLFSLKHHWGYITSGGTLGNEQGLYMGRIALARFGQPILYFSEEAHYSIASLGKILGLKCCVIASQPNGEMDYEDLKQKLNPEHPALFSLSIGTTFKGAIDRIEIIQSIVQNKGIQNVFYHADAALFGGYLPFYPDETKPSLNFQKHPYDSIAVSGHKFFGSPIPLGIFLIRYEYIYMLDAEYIEYIHTHNVTIPCSRSALNTLIFWWTVTTHTKEEFMRQAVMIIENAHYFYTQLKKRQYPVWLNPFSNTVYFKAPSMELCEHWTLSLFTCPKLGPLAHAIIMQHVDKEMIDEFLRELDSERNQNRVEI